MSYLWCTNQVFACSDVLEEDFSGYLVQQGFELNLLYDNCIANKQIHGSQCTVLWHVDDMKISHLKDGVLEEVIADFNAQYGKLTPLTMTQGKIHDYLGLTLEYSVPGEVTIHKDDYTKGILNEAPLDMDGVVLTPAAKHLFEVSADAEFLYPGERAELFHHLMAKLSFLCKHAWPNIQTAVAFLTARVAQPDTDDYKKLTWTHHINIIVRYFFVTDQIQSKEVAMEYCPTDEMLGDMFTKPPQGAMFCHFWAAV